MQHQGRRKQRFTPGSTEPLRKTAIALERGRERFSGPKKRPGTDRNRLRQNFVVQIFKKLLTLRVQQETKLRLGYQFVVMPCEQL
jgi:hypothetical protein